MILHDALSVSPSLFSGGEGENRIYRTAERRRTRTPPTGRRPQPGQSVSQSVSQSGDDDDDDDDEKSTELGQFERDGRGIERRKKERKEDRAVLCAKSDHKNSEG